MKYLLSLAGCIEADEQLYNALNNDDLIGNSWEDVNNNKYIVMTDDQIVFYKKYKTWTDYISAYNFFYVLPPDVESINQEIKENRERIYSSKTDGIYMAYVKYNMTDQTEKADQALSEWKEKIQKVKDNNPYISE